MGSSLNDTHLFILGLACLASCLYNTDVSNIAVGPIPYVSVRTSVKLNCILHIRTDNERSVMRVCPLLPLCAYLSNMSKCGNIKPVFDNRG